MNFIKYFSLAPFLFLGIANAQGSLSDKLKNIQNNLEKKPSALEVGGKVSPAPSNSIGNSTSAQSNTQMKQTGNFVLGDENSILLWSRDIDPSSEFLKAPNNLPRSTWISNPGGYYDPPQSITDAELDKFEATYYNKLYEILNSDKLSVAYVKCISNHKKTLAAAYPSMEANIASTRIQAQKTKLQNELNDIKSNETPLSQSWCGFKFLRRTLYALNVPNYIGEQNRGGSFTYAYEQLTIGHIYRAVNSLVRGDFTDEFYSDVRAELSLPTEEWVKKFNSSFMSNPKAKGQDLAPYAARVMNGYINHVGIMHTFISVKKLVKP